MSSSARPTAAVAARTDRVGGAGKGHHTAVVGLVAAVIEQGDAVDLTDGADDLLEHLGAATLAEVRDALDQAGHVGHLTVR